MDANPQFQHKVEVETGLRLPDGTEIWPPNTWHGHRMDTPEDRQRLLGVVVASAVNLGMIPADLIENYRWIVREKHLYVTVVCDSGTEMELDSPLLLPLVSAPETGTADVVPADSSATP